MTEGLTTIGVPFYEIEGSDKLKYLKWNLKSLVRHTDSPYEIIIVDNGSIEESSEWIKSFAREKKPELCKGVKVISNSENTGWTGGCNQIYENADGEYVIFANDDLVFSPNWLSKMLAHEGEDVAIIGPTSNFVAGIQAVSRNRKGVTEEKVNWLIGLLMLMPKAFLDEVAKENKGKIMADEFFPGGSDDLDLSLFAKKFGYKMVIARDVFIHHFGNRSLQLLPEFQKDQNAFYNKRQAVLQTRWPKEMLAVLNPQKCPKIAIGIPSIGHVDSQFLLHYPWIMRSLFEEFGFDGVIPIMAARTLTHVARNEIVRIAKMSGAEYLFFLDDDMIIPHDSVNRLIAHGKDFASALAYRRTPPYYPCIFTGEDEDGKVLPDTRMNQGLVEVDSTGLSCAVIKIEMFDGVKKKFPDEPLFNFSTRYGEDIHFCRKAKEAGYQIWADTDLAIGHIGIPPVIGQQTFLTHHQQQQKLKEQHEQQISEQHKQGEENRDVQQ